MTKINERLLIEKPKHFAAVDGCKGGWCVIAQVDGNVITKVVEHLEVFLSNYPQIEMVFIDIPIGLASQDYERSIDAVLRSKLPGKTSSVFTPPCREALETNVYKEANLINKSVTGKGLSIQAFYIGQKIKEIDQLIRSNQFKAVFIESHPEFCFKQLNHNEVILAKKTSIQGVAKRLNILKAHKANYVEIYEHLLNSFKRKTIKKDDILDALSIYACSELAKQLMLLDSQQTQDAKGICLGILDSRL